MKKNAESAFGWQSVGRWLPERSVAFATDCRQGAVGPRAAPVTVTEES